MIKEPIRNIEWEMMKKHKREINKDYSSYGSSNSKGKYKTYTDPKIEIYSNSKLNNKGKGKTDEICERKK